MLTHWVSGTSQSRHTPECLANRLAELEALLIRRFPGVAADCGIDAARDAGLNYIERVRAGEAGELKNGRAWLVRVAVRAAIRFLERELPCVSTDIAIPGVWPGDAIDRKRSDLAVVGAALEQLPLRQQEAVCLRVILGLSLRNVARDLGIAPQTVMKYLEKAYARLRKSLSGADGEFRSPALAPLPLDSEEQKPIWSAGAG